MSSTITAVVRTAIAVTKTASGADAGNPDLNFTSGNPAGDTYTAGTAVPVSKSAKFTATLSSGSATIDLTAIPDDLNGTFDGTGLKVQFLRFSNPSGNANKIIASNGASNPYRTDGATTAWSKPMAPGQSAQDELDNAGDTIGSSHKTIDLAGTGSQTLNVHLILG